MSRPRVVGVLAILLAVACGAAALVWLHAGGQGKAVVNFTPEPPPVVARPPAGEAAPAASVPAATVPAASAPATPGSRRPPVTPLAIIAIVVAAAIISSHPGLLVLIPIAALLIIRRRSAASTGRTDA